jgi:hypothetical protein
MNTNKKNARIAGVWYLLMSLLGTFSVMYVDASIYVPGDAASTANNLLASGGLFRLGFVCWLVQLVCFLFLANVLYKLFRPVDSSWARLLMLFVIVGVSISFLNRLNQLAPVLLLKGEVYQSAFETSQLQALALLFVDLQTQGEMISSVFWGLWLLPLGVLAWKSGFVPKVLAVLALIACFSHLLSSLAFFLYPNYSATIGSILSIGAFGEIAFFLWILVKGVVNRDEKSLS